MERFLIGYLNRNLSEYRKTIESLSAQIAYNSLDENKRIEYALFSQSIEPLFFKLSEEELKKVEKSLPPFSKIVQYIFRKFGVSEEEAKILRTRIPFYKLFTKEGRELKRRKKEVSKKILSEEWERISFEYSRKMWKDFQKLVIPLYGLGILETYLTTYDLYFLVYWLVGILPFYALKYASYKSPDRRISSHLNIIASIYFLGRSPVGFLQSIIEFGILAPKIGDLIEKVWPYTPRTLRVFIDKAEKFLSDVKPKRFDEKEIREKLYDVPKEINTSIPQYSIDKYRENVENGVLEIEDPRKSLFKPYLLGYHRRKIVVEDGRILDKEYVRKLAKIDGKFLEDVEREIERKPWKYLGIDIKDGKIVYVRDIIGIIPSEREGLYEGLARKEGYLYMLALNFDETALSLWSLQPFLSIEGFLKRFIIR